MTEEFKLVTNAQESKIFKSNVTNINIKYSNNFSRPYSVEIMQLSVSSRRGVGGKAGHEMGI